ncbi:hypothetical protein [Actinoplanes sp. NPDC051859]|uniref:hypothetical protein n=1 Tax=Actinoplanes sp. NPDC051859 TaxID=3363909 RepID=UPI00379CBC4C
MNGTRAVFGALLRRYRLPLLIAGLVLAVGVVISSLVVGARIDPSFSPWMVVAGSVVKYWLFAFGVLLVAGHLRLFAAAGLTRRAVLTGGAVLGVLSAIAAAVLTALGHGLESALIGDVSPGYPAWSVAGAVAELGHLLPICIAFFVSGAAAAVGFYRFGAWRGLPLAVPAALPLVVAEELLGVDGSGQVLTRVLPYAAGLPVSLAVTLLGALLCYWLTHGAPIRRPAMG